MAYIISGQIPTGSDLHFGDSNNHQSGSAVNSIISKLNALKSIIEGLDVSTLEGTLASGLNEVKDAVNNIDFTDLENSIAEVKNAVANIDFSALAKEDTLTQGISSVESKVEEVGNKIDNIKLPEIDTTEFAKQGENKEATNSKILEEVGDASAALTAINDILGTL